MGRRSGEPPQPGPGSDRRRRARRQLLLMMATLCAATVLIAFFVLRSTPSLSPPPGSHGTLGAVLLLAGIGVAAGCVLVFRVMARRHIAVLVPAREAAEFQPDMPCGVAAARAATAPMNGRVVGRVAPGTGVSAPVSGETCAWYHAQISALRRINRVDRFEEPVYQLAPVRRWSSDRPFTLADGSGRVEVAPAGMTADFDSYLHRTRVLGYQELPRALAPHYACERRTDDGGADGGQPGLLWEEWTVRFGDEVHVQGALRAADGVATVSAGPGAPLTVSFRDAVRRAVGQAAVRDFKQRKNVLVSLVLVAIGATIVAVEGARLLG